MRKRRYLLWIPAGLLGLLLGVWLLLVTGALNGLLLRVGLRQANSALRGEVNIGALHGNPLRSLQMEDILVRVDGDTLFAARQLAIAWYPAGLLRRHIDIEMVRLERPRIRLRKDDAGHWNATRLLPPPTPHKPPGKPFDWAVTLGELRLEDADVVIDTLVPLLPFALQANAEYTLPSAHAQLHLASGAQSVDLTLAADSLQQVPVLDVETAFEALNADVVHGTPHTHVNGNLHLHTRLSEPPAAEWRLACHDIAVDSLRADSLTSRGSLRSNLLRGQLTLLRDGGRALATIDSLHMASESYAARLRLRDFNPASVLPREELNASVTLQATIAGRGFSPHAAEAVLTLNTEKLRSARYPAADSTNLSLNMRYVAQCLRGAAQASGAWGTVDAEIDSLCMATERYSLHLRTRGLNAHRLLGGSAPKTSLHTALTLRGQGFSTDTAAVRVRLLADDSLVRGYLVDSLRVSGLLNHGQARVDSLLLRGYGLRMYAAGTASLTGTFDADLTLLADSLGALHRLTQMPDLHGSLHLRAHVRGDGQTQQGEGSFALRHLLRGNLAADSLSGEVAFSRVRQQLNAKALLRCDSLSSGGFTLRRMRLDADYSLAGAAVHLHSDLPDSTGIQLAARYDGAQTVLLDTLRLRLPQDEWRLVHTPASVRFGDGSYLVNNFELASADSRLKLHGTLAPAGISDLWFDLIARSMVVPYVLPLTYMDSLHCAVHLAGTAADPLAQLRLSLRNLTAGAYPLRKLDVTARYAARHASLRATVQPDSTGALQLEASLLAPLPENMGQSAAWTDSLHARLHSEGIDLNYLSLLSPSVQDIAGRFACDLQLATQSGQSSLDGYASLQGGGFTLPRYGFEGKDMRLGLRAQGGRLLLDSLHVATSRGDLRAQGQSSWRDTPKPALYDYSMTAHADNLLVADSRELVLRISSQLGLEPGAKRPMLRGNVRVEQARVNVNELMSRASGGDQPMLVAALPDSLKPLAYRDKPKPAPAPAPPLDVNIHVSVPHNTWLQGNDFQIELQGDVTLVLHAGEPSLTGQLKLVRGNYYIYGRRLDLLQGTLTFTGRADMMPTVDIEVGYTFRSLERQRKTLIISIKGNTDSPQLAFSLDDQRIEESDAVSYLLFGRASNELSQGEKSVMAEQADGGKIALSFLASRLQSEVTSELRKQLQLDVVEFGGTQSWDQATVILGKYLTDDLYLSYEHALRFGQKNQLENDRVSLEYQLDRHLYLQAVQGGDTETGVDLIFKWQK